jgi:hypothetical protein
VVSDLAAALADRELPEGDHRRRRPGGRRGGRPRTRSSPGRRRFVRPSRAMVAQARCSTYGPTRCCPTGPLPAPMPISVRGNFGSDDRRWTPGGRPTDAANFLADHCRRQWPRPFRRSSRQRAVGLLREAGDTERRGRGPPPSASSGDAAVLSAHAAGRDDSDSAESPSAKVGGRRRISRGAASGVALMGRARVVHSPSLATAMPKTLEKGFSGQRPVADVSGAASARVSSRSAAVVSSVRVAAGADRRIGQGDLQGQLRLEDISVAAPTDAVSSIGRRPAVRLRSPASSITK